MSKYFENYKSSEILNKRRIINTPRDSTRRNFLYIQEAGYLKSIKPHLSQRSQLKSYLFLVVVSGSGCINYNGITYTASKHDMFFIDCMNSYSHISNVDDPWELMWIHFNGINAAAYYDCFMDRHSSEKLPNCFQCEKLSDVINAIQVIIQINECKNDNTDLLTSKLITDILTLSMTTESKQLPSSLIRQKLLSITEYINDNFTLNLTLDSLSKKFYISKYYLAREFKKEYGITIISYIQIKRIGYSKELLRYSDHSIEEIACLSGIGDSSYFNRVFKKLENITASKYRKMW